jgi:glycosyltransferase involved in cell wall biosynthesis
MVVTIDATPAIKRLGGVTEYTRQLLTHLGELDHDNTYRLVTFSLFRSRTQPLPELPANFRERAIPLPARIIDRMWRQAGIPPLELFLGRPDLLFFPNIFIPYTFTPTVVTVHDLAWLKFPQFAPAGEHREFKRALVRCRQASHFIAVSQSTKKDLVEEAGISPDKITVIYEGYDDLLRTPPPVKRIAAFRKRWQLGSGPYLLFVGTIEPRKNLVRLLYAFSRFKKSTGQPHKLVLAGRPGWQYQETKKAIEESVFRQDIVMIGSLSSTDRHLAFRGADLVVFPTLYEGFGLPILEAQAAEKPILTGTGSSLEEVGGKGIFSVNVQDEKAIADGLNQLATDSKLRRDLIHEGLTNLKRFSWKKTAEETLKVFEKVVGVT